MFLGFSNHVQYMSRFWALTWRHYISLFLSLTSHKVLFGAVSVRSAQIPGQALQSILSKPSRKTCLTSVSYASSLSESSSVTHILSASLILTPLFLSPFLSSLSFLIAITLTHLLPSLHYHTYLLQPLLCCCFLYLSAFHKLFLAIVLSHGSPHQQVKGINTPTFSNLISVNHISSVCVWGGGFDSF